MAACMRWAELRGPGLANRLQTAIFGDSSGICKTRIQQQQTVAAEFGTLLLKTTMAHMEVRNRDEKTAVGMNLRSHSLDKLRQIVTTGAFSIDGPRGARSGRTAVRPYESKLQWPAHAGRGAAGGGDDAGRRVSGRTAHPMLPVPNVPTAPAQHRPGRVVMRGSESVRGGRF
jgi:hypothetical protein